MARARAPVEGYQSQGYAVRVGHQWLGPQGLSGARWYWGSRAAAERLAVAAMREHGQPTSIHRRVVERRCQGQKDLGGNLACAKAEPEDGEVPNRLLERIRERDRKRGERERAKIARAEALKEKRRAKERAAADRREAARKKAAEREAAKRQRAAKRKRGVEPPKGDAAPVKYLDWRGVPMLDPKAAPKATPAYLVGLLRTADKPVVIVGGTKDDPGKPHWVVEAQSLRAAVKHRLWTKSKVAPEKTAEESRAYLAMPKGAELLIECGYRPADSEAAALVALKTIGGDKPVAYVRAETLSALLRALVGKAHALQLSPDGQRVYLTVVGTPRAMLMVVETEKPKAPTKGKSKR